MRLIWNLLALIGLVVVVAAVYLAVTFGAQVAAFNEFDDGAFETYKKMTLQLLATGSPAQATVWKAQVADGLSFEEVDESIKSVAIENNIKGCWRTALVEPGRGDAGQALAQGQDLHVLQSLDRRQDDRF